MSSHDYLSSATSHDRNTAPVIIVGGGLAGLCCARVLQRSDVPWMLVEASDRLGGRVRTEALEGFQLDFGFQVLLTSYPEAIRGLNYDKLKLGRFQPGALIRHQGKFRRFADPWRVPKSAIATAFSPVGTFGDKLRVGRLRGRLARGELDALLSQPETSTIQRLTELGFSESMIDSFFRPFFRGVFLESELSTSSRKFEYLFRLFSCGFAALPAGGMGEIVCQLAESLPQDRIHLETPVEKVSEGSILLSNGRELVARQVVIACDAWNAAKLMGTEQPARGFPSAVFYFAAERPPIEDPVLILSGDESGPVVSLCVPSQVANGYAAEGQSLISVSVHIPSPDQRLPACPKIAEVTDQLSDWFGSEVSRWRHLKTIVVENALPVQDHLEVATSSNDHLAGDCRAKAGIVVCGDYRDVASIQGAMRSGRLAGELLVQQLGSA